MGFIITTEEFWLKRKSNQNDKAMIQNGKKNKFWFYVIDVRNSKIVVLDLKKGSASV